MICRGCGERIPDILLRDDRFRCPECGKPYIRRGARTTENEIPGRFGAMPVSADRPTAAESRKVKKSKPNRARKHMLAAALCLIAAALICTAGAFAVRSLNRNAPRSPRPAAAIPTLELTFFPAADPGPTPAPTDAAEGVWADTFARTKDAVLEAAQGIFSQFTLKSDMRVGFDKKKPNVYEISADVLLPAGTMRYVKSAIQFIEQSARQCPYALDFSLVFLSGENAVCVALFGASHSGYTVTGGGSTAAYPSIAAIPDRIINIAGTEERIQL